MGYVKYGLRVPETLILMLLDGRCSLGKHVSLTRMVDADDTDAVEGVVR